MDTNHFNIKGYNCELSLQNEDYNCELSPQDEDALYGIEALKPRPDNVNHPPHYETGGIECIDAMVETQGVVAVMDFCICNAFKYLWRHGRKNGIEDVRKAIWYLNKYVELADKGNYPPTTNL